MIKKQCPLNHLSSHKQIYHFENYDIIQCPVCQLRSRNKSFSLKKIKKLYSKHYFTKFQKAYFTPCLTKLNKDNYRIKDFNQRLDYLQKIINIRKPILFDVGCATGTFIKLSLDRGFIANGIDVSDYAVTKAKKQHLKVSNACMERFVTNQKYHLVTAWEVVPNFENPNLALKKIKAILKPKGVLTIQLTVIDSLIFWLCSLFYHLSFGRIKIIELGYPIHHAFHYSRHTILKMLKDNGFSIIKVENIPYNFQYSRLPKPLLPILKFISFFSILIKKTTQVRIYATVSPSRIKK